METLKNIEQQFPASWKHFLRAEKFWHAGRLERSRYKYIACYRLEADGGLK